MTLNSFVSAYRRFVGCRGPFRQIQPDQGTNFLGVKNELQLALSELDHDKIKQEPLKRNCDWVHCKTNAPKVCHMGGSWQNYAKHALSPFDVPWITAWPISHNNMVEAKSIVNRRPLALNDLSSPDCLQPLSPNQLLTLKSHAVLPPPGSFHCEDLYSKKRWQSVQYPGNEFWVKWKVEFLQLSQGRQKWVKSEKWWRCHSEGRIHSTKQLAAGRYQSNLSKWRWHISKGWSRSSKRFPRSYRKENKAHSLSR